MEARRLVSHETDRRGSGRQGHRGGKVWPRDEAEPKEWTVESKIRAPTARVSPALYANAMGIVDATHPRTEAYFDNVKITPNK